LSHTIAPVSARTGQLNYDFMKLKDIKLDPENPRKLAIRPEDLFKDIDKKDPLYEIKKDELAGLEELARSIKEVGVRNAIEVYKDIDCYRVITGERRLLSCLLLKEEHIPVRINKKPKEYELRYIQWIENINRKNLNLKEKYNNLIAMAKAFSEVNHREMKAEDLKNSLGISDAQAYRYLSLINADKELIGLLINDKITDLKVFSEIANIKSKASREQLLDKLTNENPQTKNISSAKLKNLTSRKNQIVLGKIKNISAAKYIFTRLITDPHIKTLSKDVDSVNWNSTASISKAFVQLFKHFEKGLMTEKVETENET
jgi:ParB/RepB/Spo0J family partition protein